MAMRAATISEAARAAGVGIETIRFYERRGLIDRPPKPESSGYRVYPEEMVKRIRFIRQAQQLGFSLREIEELLSLRADPSADCSEVRAQAIAKLQEIHRKIAQLREIGAALEALVAACPGSGGLQTCSIMDMLVDASEVPMRTGEQLPAHQTKRPVGASVRTKARRLT